MKNTRRSLTCADWETVGGAEEPVDRCAGGRANIREITSIASSTHLSTKLPPNFLLHLEMMML